MYLDIMFTEMQNKNYVFRVTKTIYNLERTTIPHRQNPIISAKLKFSKYSIATTCNSSVHVFHINDILSVTSGIIDRWLANRNQTYM